MLTEKWDVLKTAFEERTQHEPQYQLPGDTVYDVYTALLSEVSNNEIDRVFQGYTKDLAGHFGRLVSLKRRELGRASKGRKGLTRAEMKELREKWQHYMSDSGNFFLKLQDVWMTLALHGDDWLATKFKDYCELMDEIYQLEQAATHNPELKHHRPSEIWERGRRRQNKRGKYIKGPKR